MTAETLTANKPRWAVIAYVDDNNVFVEIPIKDQAPFIAKYPLSAEGLGQALRQMREFHREKSGPPIYTPPPRIASTPSPYKDDTRAKARAALVKAGIIK